MIDQETLEVLSEELMPIKNGPFTLGRNQVAVVFDQDNEQTFAVIDGENYYSEGLPYVAIMSMAAIFLVRSDKGIAKAVDMFIREQVASVKDCEERSLQ